MKADTGRILRQRFCFLMAMVSCSNGDRWCCQVVGDPPLGLPVPHKAFSGEKNPTSVLGNWGTETREEAGLDEGWGRGRGRPDTASSGAGVCRDWKGAMRCRFQGRAQAEEGKERCGVLTMLVPSSSSVVSSWSWFRPRPREDRSCPWPGPPDASDRVLSWVRCRAWGKRVGPRMLTWWWDAYRLGSGGGIQQPHQALVGVIEFLQDLVHYGVGQVGDHRQLHFTAGTGRAAQCFWPLQATVSLSLRGQPIGLTA